jgi:para-aminobenzoate synthetase component 1
MFSCSFEGDPFLIFTKLFKLNPAPFYAFIHTPDHSIISTSPERFIYQNGNYIETRPIKGTMPRGKSPEDDKLNAKILNHSPKDDAELSMIVDLMRNDLSKICLPHTVKVIKHKILESYTNVFHLVSVVSGELRPGTDSIDIFKASFPAGSITGCPKIRSMEIITEIENTARGVYTGSIGYISLFDTMDMNVAIRSATIYKNMLYFNVGGGIVYDSKPEMEYLETLHKGKTFFQVLKLRR